jgi:hypothetical protein
MDNPLIEKLNQLHPNPPAAKEAEEVIVDIRPEIMMDDFAVAFLRECERINPLTFERVNLTDKEMIQYCRFLMVSRIQCIEGSCRIWNGLKDLMIPSFIQLCLSLVGRYHDIDHGLIFIPKTRVKAPITLEEARIISGKIEAFKANVVMFKDAMPRSSEGDSEVMTCALINNVIASVDHVGHDVFTYISAFMGMKLREEATFGLLYRVRYDDLVTITSKMINSRVIYDAKE